jgi:hypothetical protein
MSVGGAVAVRIIGTVPVLLLLGCAEQPDPKKKVVIDSIGDTIVVTSYDSPPTIRMDSTTVEWQSFELESPDRLTIVGQVLVIGDMRRLHLLDLVTKQVVTVGRGGDGPGEFRSIAAIGAMPGDRIGVYDAALRRLTIRRLP